MHELRAGGGVDDLELALRRAVAADNAHVIFDALSQLVFVAGVRRNDQGAAQAYGFDPDRLEFILTQLVALYRGGEQARMSKRAGDLVTLDELLDEVGPDAARYTLLSRSSDTPLA